MAAKKTTKPVVEEKEIVVEEVIETPAVNVEEAVVTPEIVEEEKTKPGLIANVEGVAIYSIPSYDKKFKIGTLPAFTKFDILDIVSSTIYGKFYKIESGFVSRENNLTLID